jgi:hypothetical protein
MRNLLSLLGGFLTTQGIFQITKSNLALGITMLTLGVISLTIVGCSHYHEWKRN